MERKKPNPLNWPLPHLCKSPPNKNSPSCYWYFGSRVRYRPTHVSSHLTDLTPSAKRLTFKTVFLSDHRYHISRLEDTSFPQPQPTIFKGRSAPWYNQNIPHPLQSHSWLRSPGPQLICRGWRVETMHAEERLASYCVSKEGREWSAQTCFFKLSSWGPTSFVVNRESRYIKTKCYILSEFQFPWV